MRLMRGIARGPGAPRPDRLQKFVFVTKEKIMKTPRIAGRACARARPLETPSN
jgi:hypothetical protein